MPSLSMEIYKKNFHNRKRLKFLVFVVYSFQYRLKRICKLYSVYIYILHNVPPSVELGLYMNVEDQPEEIAIIKVFA